MYTHFFLDTSGPVGVGFKQHFFIGMGVRVDGGDLCIALFDLARRGRNFEDWWVSEVIRYRGTTNRNRECTPGYYNFEGEDNASITAGSRPSLEKAIQVLGTPGLEKCFVSRTMTTRGETIMCADSKLGATRTCTSPRPACVLLGHSYRRRPASV